MEISRRHPVSLALIHCHGDQVTAIGLRDMFRECADCLKVSVAMLVRSDNLYNKGINVFIISI